VRASVGFDAVSEITGVGGGGVELARLLASCDSTICVNRHPALFLPPRPSQRMERVLNNLTASLPEASLY